MSNHYLNGEFPGPVWGPFEPLTGWKLDHRQKWRTAHRWNVRPVAMFEAALQEPPFSGAGAELKDALASVPKPEKGEAGSEPFFTYPHEHPVYFAVEETGASGLPRAEAYVLVPGEALAGGEDLYFRAEALEDVWRANRLAYGLLEENPLLLARRAEEAKASETVEEHVVDYVDAEEPPDTKEFVAEYRYEHPLGDGGDECALRLAYRYDQERTRPWQNLVWGHLEVGLLRDGEEVPTMLFLRDEAADLFYAECARRSVAALVHGGARGEPQEKGRG